MCVGLCPFWPFLFSPLAHLALTTTKGARKKAAKAFSRTFVTCYIYKDKYYKNLVGFVLFFPKLENFFQNLHSFYAFPRKWKEDTRQKDSHFFQRFQTDMQH